MKTALKHVAQAAVRRILPPTASADDARTEPISRQFGLDRGQPIDRYYIAKFLERHSADIRGVALEVAEPTYATIYRRQLSRVEILHVSPGAPHATIVGDLTDIATLPPNIADCFICTQVLPFIFDIAAAIRGVHHVLKPGGTVLATMSGIAQISRYDMDNWGDYWRFTERSAQMSFAKVFAPENISVETHGNLSCAKAFLDGLAVEDLTDPRVLDVADSDYPVTVAVRAVKNA